MSEGRLAIEANVRLAIDELGPLSDLDFGLNPESVEWVEGFIERQRGRPDFDPEKVSGLVGVLGSFLGQCIVDAAGGDWHWSEAERAWCVRFTNGAMAFPFTKVRKLFRDGLEGGQSIVSFYRVTVQHIATGRIGSGERPED
jgi:hypothetical protein